MLASEERAFEAKAERELSGYRSPPDGRDFRAFKERDRTDINNEEFDAKFDNTFPDAPGGPQWVAKQFCPICDIRVPHCICDNPESERRHVKVVGYHSGGGLFK